jgi:predicted RNA binding protein YcfA (HicA-like mRNA interferase family)
LPHHKPVSGDEVIRVLCNKFGFVISGRSGSHVRLSKITPEGKTGTVVPLHDEVKPGTLRGVLRLAKVDIDEFYRYI